MGKIMSRDTSETSIFSVILRNNFEMKIKLLAYKHLARWIFLGIFLF